jgi:hypothetical protein
MRIGSTGCYPYKALSTVFLRSCAQLLGETGFAGRHESLQNRYRETMLCTAVRRAASYRVVLIKGLINTDYSCCN